MKIVKKFLHILTLAFVVTVFCNQALALDHCYSKMSEVLDCFLKYDDGVYKYEFIEEDNKNPQLISD